MLFALIVVSSLLVLVYVAFGLQILALQKELEKEVKERERRLKNRDTAEEAAADSIRRRLTGD